MTDTVQLPAGTVFHQTNKHIECVMCRSVMKGCIILWRAISYYTHHYAHGAMQTLSLSLFQFIIFCVQFFWLISVSVGRRRRGGRGFRWGSSKGVSVRSCCLCLIVIASCRHRRRLYSFSRSVAARGECGERQDGPSVWHWTAVGWRPAQSRPLLQGWRKSFHLHVRIPLPHYYY